MEQNPPSADPSTPGATPRGARPSPRRAPTKRAAAPRAKSRDAQADPPETPLARRALADVIERFVPTLGDPIQQAIAPHAIHALTKFGEIHRRPARSLTFGWIDPHAVIEGTPIDDEHPAGLAAAYFGVLAGFYRFRAAEGALDRETADRIAGVYLQASISLARLESGGPRHRS
ncbi:MAG: hypothetical protein K1X94_13165 [Sandaracinaceae bacterium]|jgi:hypothetical protein|nr:hypothetical protein [Sandaracinaceae bacterium]